MDSEFGSPTEGQPSQEITAIRHELTRLRGHVDELRSREDIRSVLYGYCRAMDRGDRELLLSLYHEDAIDEHGAYVGNIEGFWDWVMRSMHSGLPHDSGKIVAMTHSLGTINISLEGDIAHAESYFEGLNVAERPDGSQYVSVMNGRYSDRFERREDGVWRIAHRKVIKDLRDVRPITLNPQEKYLSGRRDRLDPGYPYTARSTTAARDGDSVGT